MSETDALLGTAIDYEHGSEDIGFKKALVDKLRDFESRLATALESNAMLVREGNAVQTRLAAAEKDARLDRPEPLRSSELDVIGKLFAIRFVNGCSNGCVELYVEDDDWYHHKATFDRAWLNDLLAVVKRAIDAALEQKP